MHLHAGVESGKGVGVASTGLVVVAVQCSAGSVLFWLRTLSLMDLPLLLPRSLVSEK